SSSVQRPQRGKQLTPSRHPGEAFPCAQVEASLTQRQVTAECCVCIRRLKACRLCIRTNRCADPSFTRDTPEDGSTGGITEEDVGLDDVVEQIEQGRPLGQGILPIEECPSVAGPQEIPRSAIAMPGAHRTVLGPA